MSNALIKFLLLPLLPTIVRWVLKMVGKKVSDLLDWLEALAAKTDNPVDDRLIEMARDFFDPEKNEILDVTVARLFEWLYAFARRTDNDWDDAIVKEAAKFFGVNLENF